LCGGAWRAGVIKELIQEMQNHRSLRLIKCNGMAYSYCYWTHTHQTAQ